MKRKTVRKTADEAGIRVACNVNQPGVSLQSLQLFAEILCKKEKIRVEHSAFGFEKATLSKWTVKDAEGEYFIICADYWECSGKGLQFFIDDKIVSWFTSWQHFRKNSD